jgi:hypothetical protein
MAEADEDPTAAELAQLRKEKADRDAADKKAHDEEVAALRKYKEENEKTKTTAPKPVKTKTEKEAEKKTEEETKPDPTGDKPKEEKRSHGGSRRWFGE